MKRLIFIFVIITSLFTSGCSLDDSEANFHFSPLRIVSANLPESFQLNQTYDITVIYELPDDCTSFSGFDITQSDTTVRNVVVFGAVRTDTNECIEEVKVAQTSFRFNCQYTDTYMFRFWQGVDANGEQQYFEIEVPVN